MGRGRGRGRAMDDRVDLTQEDVHRVSRQTARQRVQEEIEERDHDDDEDDDDDDQVRRDSRAKGLVYEVKLFKGQSCSSPRCYSICVKKTRRLSRTLLLFTESRHPQQTRTSKRRSPSRRLKMAFPQASARARMSKNLKTSS